MPIKDPVKRRAYEKRRNATPKRRRARSLNVMARRKMKKKYGIAKLRGKDVHHKRPITRGGTNSIGNLAVISARKNRQMKTKRRRR